MEENAARWYTSIPKEPPKSSGCPICGGVVLGIMDRIRSLQETERFKRLRRWWINRRREWDAYADSFRDKERWAIQFTPRRIAVFVLDFLWAIVLWGIIFTKIAGDGVFTYIGYFTNWSWIYQAVYYLIYLFSYLESPRTRYLEFWLLYAIWWNVFAQTIIILVLVFAIFQDDAFILIGETKTGGGKYNDGTVINYNFLVHYCPPIVALLNMWIIWPDIADMLSYTFAVIEYHGEAPELCDTTRFVYAVKAIPAWVYIFVSTVFAVIPLLAFYNVFDVREVYHLEDFPTWAGIIVTVVIAFAVVMLPMQYMFRSTIPSRPVPAYQRKAAKFDENATATYQLTRIPLPSE